MITLHALSTVQFNRFQKSGKESGQPEFVPEILQHLDGFLLVGYRKGTRKKHVMLASGDDACSDGLSFFER